ncbi:MAG: DUF2264 domain-containing protein [Acidimicrobiia bacterium]|nr:MAG: DUF2264 domain-containing protein [Acidimicrobiia bacterium]
MTMRDRSYIMSNPLYGNPLRDRDDLQRAMRSLFTPLLPYFSEGGARVRLGMTASKFPTAATELEGFARPLWGLGPLAAGGGEFEHWDVVRSGLVNGTDPDHPEYWGEVTDRGQQIVESASLGFSLALAPEELWHPLTGNQQQNLGYWLERIIDLETPANNWNFFPVVVALGLDSVGWPVDWSRLEHRFDTIEHFYLADGWYRDGPGRRLDHYVAFSFHFYGLLYAKLRKGDDARRGVFVDRAVAFAKDFKTWFASDGAGLPFGRSLTYRFAHAGFWAALAFSDVDALPLGETKGLLLSNLRWWRDQPIADRDGVLSLGYSYPNLAMTEEYNSLGSPYWAAKAFVALSLPEDHPFWQADEIAPQPPTDIVSLPIPGMLMYGEPRNTTALVTGQEHPDIRQGAEKYSKFAYSTRYGFSVEGSDTDFVAGAFDNMLALSDNGLHYRIRMRAEDARISQDTLYSTWKPWQDIEVETWLIAEPPWHLRIHRIFTPRALESAEGGFATDRTETKTVQLTEIDGAAAIQTTDDFSGIRILEGSTPRRGVITAPMPNTNLVFPRSLVPQLRTTISAGRTLLASAILASPNMDRTLRTWTTPPDLPDEAELDRRRSEATPIQGWIAAIDTPPSETSDGSDRSSMSYTSQGGFRK